MRRSATLHAAAFLVDQDVDRTPQRVPDGRDQLAHLRRRVDIALEQDDAERVGLLQEAALLRSQCQTAATADERTHRLFRLSYSAF